MVKTAADNWPGRRQTTSTPSPLSPSEYFRGVRSRLLSLLRAWTLGEAMPPFFGFPNENDWVIPGEQNGPRIIRPPYNHGEMNKRTGLRKAVLTFAGFL